MARTLVETVAAAGVPIGPLAGTQRYLRGRSGRLLHRAGGCSRAATLEVVEEQQLSWSEAESAGANVCRDLRCRRWPYPAWVYADVIADLARAVCGCRAALADGDIADAARLLADLRAQAGRVGLLADDETGDGLGQDGRLWGPLADWCGQITAELAGALQAAGRDGAAVLRRFAAAFVAVEPGDVPDGRDGVWAVVRAGHAAWADTLAGRGDITDAAHAARAAAEQAAVRAGLDWDRPAADAVDTACRNWAARLGRLVAGEDGTSRVIAYRAVGAGSYQQLICQLPLLFEHRSSPDGARGVALVPRLVAERLVDAAIATQAAPPVVLGDGRDYRDGRAATFVALWDPAAGGPGPAELWRAAGALVTRPGTA